MDFFVGFFFAFPSALLICIGFCYLFAKRNDSNIAYDLTVIKEDLANLQVKLSGFLNHV
jgi:hypothetical protein